MKIAVIGAGFTGLSAAEKLSSLGHDVSVFESDLAPGGLAGGFKDPAWEWKLDKHYHHLFTSDTAVLDLCKKIGFPVDFSRPVTSTLTPTGAYRLDSPFSLLSFPDLTLLDRLRTGMVLGYLRYLAGWRPLENITARDFLTRYMGSASWKVLWEPLFEGKFHYFADKVNTAWFWARIKKRSSALGYPRGGFASLAESLVKACRKNGTRFYFRHPVGKITSSSPGAAVYHGGRTSFYDRVICTLSSSAFSRLAPSLPAPYAKNISSLPFLGAVNLVLELNKPFLPENIYWLNINRPGIPFLSAVEHTNFISADHYAGSHLLYVGNYLPSGHPYYGYSPEKLLRTYLPGLKIINPDFSSADIKKSRVWAVPFAQPVPGVGHSSRLPGISTPLPGVFLANMQQVYPWDRGVNYAVELGQKVAGICTTG